jgi:hypothetical protein
MAVCHRFEAPSPAVGNVPNRKQGINFRKRNNQNFVSQIECRNAQRISAPWNAAEEESIGTLGTIVEQVEAVGFAAPEIAVIGNVVNLHGLLSGFRLVYQIVD